MKNARTRTAEVHMNSLRRSLQYHGNTDLKASQIVETVVNELKEQEYYSKDILAILRSLKGEYAFGTAQYNALNDADLKLDILHNGKIDTPENLREVGHIPFHPNDIITEAKGDPDDPITIGSKIKDPLNASEDDPENLLGYQNSGNEEGVPLSDEDIFDNFYGENDPLDELGYRREKGLPKRLIKKQRKGLRTPEEEKAAEDKRKLARDRMNANKWHNNGIKR